jgi:hypothetical protein
VEGVAFSHSLYGKCGTAEPTPIRPPELPPRYVYGTAKISLTKSRVTMALFICSNYLSVGLRSEGNSASAAKAVAASDINMRGQESPSSPPCSRS